MYRPDELKTELSKLWGWRQNYNASQFSIDKELTTSLTGQYYQEVHPLMTFDNIRALAPEFTDSSYGVWSASKSYVVGDKISLGGVHYVAIDANVNVSPDNSGNTDWEVFDAFSDWLKQKTEASILKAVRSFWDAKMSKKEMTNVLEAKTLFDGTGRIKDVIENNSNIVGFELVPIRANGVTTKINKIGLQFTDVDEITLHLHHSSRNAPIKSQTFERTLDGGMEWFDVSDFILPYSSKAIDSGGSWYLVYDQTTLANSKAVNKEKDWSKKPCFGCNASERQNFRTWSKYLEVHPFKIQSSQKDVGALWDVADNLYTYETNYGLNLQISIECDITDILIEQKKSLQNIIGLQVANDMLREFAFNPQFKIGRTQQNPALTITSILYELDGDSQGYKKSGLGYELDKAMAAVSVSFENMSRVCTPCRDKGIRYKTI